MKNIVLGITGGISAYKSAHIVSLLRKKNYAVTVVMTANATRFITPYTLEILSGNPVYTDLCQQPEKGIGHITLAQWADVILIAPATYNIVGKIANGIADDILSTIICATTKPVYFALAMNTVMYENPILWKNIGYLQELGYTFIEAEEGLLACGVEGKGRLKKEEDIIAIIEERYKGGNALYGKTVLITAGRTEEAIDPVRYISNSSSGKMGYALVQACINLGAKVILVSGPSMCVPPNGIHKYILIRSASEMYTAVMKEYPYVDIAIACSAVADYTPKNYSHHKIKKDDTTLKIVLERTPDILATMGKEKIHQFLIGFALETEHLLEYAQKKLLSKNLDMIIANDISVLNKEESTVHILTKNSKDIAMKHGSKRDIADFILTHIIQILRTNT